FQDIHPVAPGDLLDQFAAIAPVGEQIEEVWQAGYVSDRRRDHRSVEIGTQSNPVFSQGFKQRVNVPNHDIQVGIRGYLPVGAQETCCEVQPDKTAAVAYSVKLPSGEV